MKSHQSLIAIITIISFSISILTSFLLTTNNKLQSNTICNFDCNNNNNGELPLLINSHNLKVLIGNTVDTKYDTKLITLDKTTQMPEIHGFHDIVSTQISKMYNNDLTFTINLDDDPNKNKKYESTYLWLISHLDPLNEDNHVFTIIIPNFGSESNFRIKGWYLAIYDNINNKYSLPLSRIDKMTDNKVEITIDPNLIGDILEFNYTTAVMIRVNNTFLDKQPDYLIDSSPDDNTFWSKWFL
ncbi:MAG: hypothetical protein P0116_00715 [Candidatus Nitrosocosmicus sp.]|nr:hypothetical protein [Candidatus Nitrosocosmicus sp.]